jgi:asparagine synthase (glutamine-hydrolysing)
LQAYQRWGPDFARHIEGIFIIAILDKHRDMLLLVNDRFGLFPCYFTQTGRGFFFGPSGKSVLEGAQVSPCLDLTALAEYMRFQHLLGNKTFFEDVFLLPNATSLSLDLEHGKLSLRSYWDFNNLPDIRRDLSFDEAATEAGRLLRLSIEKRSPAGSPTIGVYLSGGMDSRTILGLIDRQAWPEIHTFTFGRHDCLDVHYAAKSAGSSHHW